MKNIRKKIIAVIVVIAGIIVLASFSKLIETNQQGEYQVKQEFLTGKMSARMVPGTYGQWLGDITTYRAVATVGLGNEKGEGSADIAAVEVTYNDGSKGLISGLARVSLPATAEGLITIKKEFADGYDHFIRSGIVPIVKNAVKLSANLRSAQDAYTTMALLQQDIQDQLENGIFKTTSDRVEIVSSTGEVEIKQVTTIVRDSLGFPVRVSNKLQEYGCEVTFVMDVPVFDPKVEEMISLRKDEAMKTELAKQAALRAKQDALTAEQQGLANVATAKYEKEVEKIKAVTDAQKAFEVAELQAKQANQEKIKKIQIATGIAEELRIADGLSERERYEIDARVKESIGVAEHMSKWVGPQIVMGGSGGSGGSGVENALMIQMMKEIIKK